jgi:hypothetical protein
MMAVNFVPGWSHAYAVAAEDRMVVSGRYAVVNMQAAAKPRPAVSLSHLRSRYLKQGQAGTCWATSPAQLFEVSARSLGFEPFPACRRLIAFEGKQLEGGDNPTNGGSPTDAIRVMTDGGVGVAHEDLCPYSDNPTVLGQKPPAIVYADARKSHLQVPISVKSVDQVIALIDGQGGTVPGLPTVNGFMCPVEMQSSATFVGSVSGFLGGHSILVWGYALPGVFDEYTWLECENWWDRIYHPLPPSLAARVVGYEPVTPTATTSQWIRRDVYLQCCQQGCEHTSATSISGLLKSGHVVASDDLVRRLGEIFMA